MQLLTSDEISQLPDLSVGEIVACGSVTCCAVPRCTFTQTEPILQMSYWWATAERHSSGRHPCTKGFRSLESAGDPLPDMAIASSVLEAMTLRKRQHASMTRKCWI